jgi:hypothetical protein
MPEIKLGSSDQNTGGQVTPWQQWFQRYARSYAPAVDGYVGTPDVAAIRTLQTNLARAGASLVIDGVFGDRTAAAVGFKWKGASTPPAVEQRRPIWIYSAPGSGADYWVGPSNELGEYARDVLKLNHQPLYFQKGGYLGFLGGDPKFSYNEVIWDQYLSLKHCLSVNPDVTRAMTTRRTDPRARVDVEIHLSGYSQSAHGMLEACLLLFGDGGPYELIRDRLNLLLMFGNPATRDTGIADRVYPEWMNAKTVDFNNPGDFYAFGSDEIRRAMFQIIVQAEMELPFFVHVLRIAVPIIEQWATVAMPFLTPFLGGFGPMVQIGLGMLPALQGLGNNPLLGNMLGQAGSNKDRELDQRLLKLLSPMGVLQNIPALIGLIAALPGLQAHGDFAPLVPRACRALDDFRKV